MYLFYSGSRDAEISADEENESESSSQSTYAGSKQSAEGKSYQSSTSASIEKITRWDYKKKLASVKWKGYPNMFNTN